MKRRDLIKGAGAGLLAGSFTSAHAADLPAIRWRMASSFPKSLDTIYGAGEALAKRLEQITQGKFQIRVYAAGEIVPGLQVLDAVQKGTIECGHSAGYYYVGKNKAFAFDTALPFGLNARQQNSWMVAGGGLKLTREFFKDYNIVNFPGGNTGTQMGGWFRKEIKSLADIKGLKFRTGGFSGRVWERMGGVAANIPGAEIYQALEKGTIDAAEWVGPYDDLKLGFYKVASNYAYPGFWEGGPQLDLHVNTKAYDALPAEYKAIIEAASAYAHVDMQAKYDGRNAAALKQLVSLGAKLFPFPKDVMDLAFKESMALYSELSASNPAWKKVYEDYAVFRRDVNLWFRFTEATFDDFMQRQKL